MIIDLILNRKDGISYNAHDFYVELLEYGDVDISMAMDEGTETDVKLALKNYIDANEYNKNIKSYIDSVNWL